MVRGRPWCFVRERAERSSEAGGLARSRDGQEDRYDMVRPSVMKMMNRHCGTIPVVEWEARLNGMVTVRKVLLLFQRRWAYPFPGSEAHGIGGMTMRITFSVFLIMVLVQTSVSVRAEQQDVTVTAVMKGSTTISGQKIEYPKTDKAEMSSVLVEIQPGKENGRHMHAVPTYVHVLEGTMTVEFEDGTRQTFKAGTGFLEVVNTVHSAKNLGDVPLKLLVVFVGEEGKPNLIRPEQHQTSNMTK